jgi:hypothetical protein
LIGVYGLTNAVDRIQKMRTTPLSQQASRGCVQ